VNCQTSDPVLVESTWPKVLLLLSDWWARPDAARTSHWANKSFSAEARLLVGAHDADALSTLDRLLAAFTAERHQLAEEYERLFVGPAAIPCPPYEAVWRTDRPSHEQRTVIGPSTEHVKQLYSEMGLRLRGDHSELADHITVELEALAYAIGVAKNGHVTDALSAALACWLPLFCTSVTQNSRLDFYRALAQMTLVLFSSSVAESTSSAHISASTSAIEGVVQS
jgi:putative dimethyl sulfoxide reductase chaperone